MMLAATFRSAVTRTSISAVILAALAGCGGTSEPAVPPKDVKPATITPLLTDTLRGVVGAAANGPLSVTVKNAAGEPIDTVLVTFAVTAGNGTIANASVRTNATGQASTTWVLGPLAGVQKATATVGTLAPVTFTAVASVGAPTIITKAAGDAQTAPVTTNVPIAPSVKLTDALGNAVSGAVVTFTVGSGGGQVTGATVNTNASGTATVGSWRLGTSPGANTLVATSGSLTVTFTATATVGPAATLTLTPVTIPELFLGQTAQLAARVVDASGNVLPNPTVTYTTSNSSIASVSGTGLITAAGPGTATITATSGAAAANIAVTVTGHPSGLATNIIDLGALPGDVAFTNNAMLAAISSLLKVAVFDRTGTTQTGTVLLSGTVPILLAPTRAGGPAVAIDAGGISRLFFIDPATATVIDSATINELVIGAAMTTDGSRVFAMLNSGEMAVYDGATHGAVARIPMGGGVTKVRIAPGDTLLYALTTVGVIFEIDVRTSTVKRQIIANTPTSVDFAIGRDGLFYLLDSNNSLVRLFNINTGSTVRALGVSGLATSIAVTPDGQQIWVTHADPAQVTIYTGNATNGFIASGTVSTSVPSIVSSPLRIYFSPSGSFAAVTNSGGWINIIR